MMNIARQTAVLAVACIIRAFPAFPQDISTCVFNTHGAAVGSIEYAYHTRDNDPDVTRGTGFIISPEGHMLTNNHVLSPRNESDAPVSQEKVTVHVGGFRTTGFPAQIIARDSALDVALIKLDRYSDPWPTVTLGDSTKLTPGAPLTALGFPGGDLSFVPTSQITSRNSIIHDLSKPWWQTALPLNPGNSGGPVFDTLDTVVGIAVAYDEGAQRISYVLPLQYALDMAQKGGAKPGSAGPCAIFPACPHPAHGIDHFAVDKDEGGWSEWRGGGYNRNAYCGDVLRVLQSRYSDATFEKIKDDEGQRVTDNWPNLRHAEYRYYCSYRVTSDPIYKVASGPECLNH